MSPFGGPRRLVPVAFAVCLTLLAGSGVLAQEPESSPEPSAGPEVSAAPVEHRPLGGWDVAAFDAWGQGLVEPRTAFTVLLLSEGRLEGETGCGTYHGRYSVDGASMGLRVVSKGPDPCGTKRTEEAVAFSVALDAVESWMATASGLELLDETGAVRVILDAVTDTGLTGAWVADGYVRNNGKPAEPLAQFPIRVIFGEDGTVEGSTGCRLFEGGYERESDRVVIAPIETTGLPCEGDLRRQERRVLRLFDEIVLWQRDGDRLSLTDGVGSPLLELVAEAEPSVVDASTAPTEPPE